MDKQRIGERPTPAPNGLRLVAGTDVKAPKAEGQRAKAPQTTKGVAFCGKDAIKEANHQP